MSKDRLEEIKRVNSEHMKQYYGTSAVPTEHFKWLIEQAERVQELEKDYSYLEHNYSLETEQNKLYRKSLETIFNRALDFSSYEDLDVHNPELFQFLSAVSFESQQALEGES